MDKYVNSNEFEMNSFDAERVVAREAQERAEKFANNPNIIAAEEAKRRQEKEHAESLRRIQAAEKLRFAMDRDIELFSKQEAQKYEQQKAYEEQQELEERRRKIHAVNEAYQRYRKKSSLYRLFHKNINKMSHKNMTVEEIDQLYGGKSR